MPFLKPSLRRIFTFVLLLCTGFLAAAGQDGPSNPVAASPGKQITLNVIVTDRNRQVVTNLKAADFLVYEDGAPQQVVAANLSDVPACLGILLDNSGSMRHTLPTVSAALYDFVKMGNPETVTFLVNFNDDSYLDVNFTNHPEKIREGLGRADARGGTALYDTIIASLNHLSKKTNCGQRVLLLLTDGEDNSSHESKAQAIVELRHSGGVVLYAVGLPYDKVSGSAKPRIRKQLEELALPTGGTVSFIENLKDTDKVLQAIAEQIRNQYSITYIQSNATGNRDVKGIVTVSPSVHNEVAVRVAGKPVAARAP